MWLMLIKKMICTCKDTTFYQQFIFLPQFFPLHLNRCQPRPYSFFTLPPSGET